VPDPTSWTGWRPASPSVHEPDVGVEQPGDLSERSGDGVINLVGRAVDQRPAVTQGEQHSAAAPVRKQRTNHGKIDITAIVG